MPEINPQDIALIVAILTGMTGFHFTILKAVDRRIENVAEDIVREHTAPVVQKLTAIETKLNNGILGASKEHGDGIVSLQIQTARIETRLAAEMATTNTHLSNLSSQLEALLAAQ